MPFSLSPLLLDLQSLSRCEFKAAFPTKMWHAGHRILLSGILAGVSDFLLKKLRIDGVEVVVGIMLDMVHVTPHSQIIPIY